MNYPSIRIVPVTGLDGDEVGDLCSARSPRSKSSGCDEHRMIRNVIQKSAEPFPHPRTILPARSIALHFGTLDPMDEQSNPVEPKIQYEAIGALLTETVERVRCPIAFVVEVAIVRTAEGLDGSLEGQRKGMWSPNP